MLSRKPHLSGGIKINAIQKRDRSGAKVKATIVESGLDLTKAR
jgi:hypothetical protein